ncbi:MAG: hypothetical protein N2037_04425 [Acidimicrobiales bacterium]|nr:hypothetical protein [Acidimicrobiales bacterium]
MVADRGKHRALLQDRWVTPLWLAHHFPDEYERCVRFGRTRVCRRCLVLYPLAFVIMVVGLGSGFGTGPLGAGALVALPLPAVIEFLLEQLRVLRYNPLRQVAVTIPLAVGLGFGFARYLSHPADPVFWAVVATYAGVCASALLWRWHRQ